MNLKILKLEIFQSVRLTIHTQAILLLIIWIAINYALKPVKQF